MKVHSIEIQHCETGEMKTIHINSAKLYVNRLYAVNSVTIMGNDVSLDDSKVVRSGSTNNVVSEKITVLLNDFMDLLDGSIDKYVAKPVEIVIEDGAKPFACKPYCMSDAMYDKVKSA